MAIARLCSRCLAVAICIPALVSGPVSLYYAAGMVKHALFTPGVRPVDPNSGEIVGEAMSLLLQPAAFLFAAAVLWLMADIHRTVGVRSLNKSAADMPQSQNESPPDSSDATGAEHEHRAS